MSAECHKCGFDLVYSSYPKMFCPNCSAKDEINKLRKEIRDLKSNIKELEELLEEKDGY